jgi:hypothetical protein
VVTAARALEEIGRTAQFDQADAAWLALTLETERLISMLRTVIALSRRRVIVTLGV